MDNSFELARGYVFVGGLHWQALSAAPSQAKSEAQQLAKQLSFDLAVSRITGAHQIGFASTADGYKAGMLSAAAVVSKTIEVESGERDFLCATEVPDGRFLYVAQVDGVIPPEGDFIGSAEEVRSRMLEDMSIGKAWNMVVAPVMWGMQDSVERSFEDFIPRKGGKLDFKHAWWALKPVKPSVGALLKSVLPFAIVGLVIAVGAIGYKQWEQEQEAKKAAQLAAIQANEPIQELPHPWKDKPRAKRAVASCTKGFEGVATLWPGNWKPETLLCSLTSGSITVTWKRGEYGWIKHLLEIEPKANVSGDGSMATLVIPIDVSGTDDETLVDERTRSLELQMIAQEYRLTITVAAPAAAPSMPGALPNDQIVPRWRELAWSIKGSALPPEIIVASLDGAGFRVGTVTARFSDGLIKWDLEGSQYVLP